VAALIPGSIRSPSASKAARTARTDEAPLASPTLHKEQVHASTSVTPPPNTTYTRRIAPDRPAEAHQGLCQGTHGGGDAYGDATVGYGGKPELLTISQVGLLEPFALLLKEGFVRKQHEEQDRLDGATVPVAVVTSRTEAELIVGMLRNNDLSAAVSADDAGGQEPELQLQGVRVLVALSDETSARRLLAAAGETPARDRGGSSSREKAERAWLSCP